MDNSLLFAFANDRDMRAVADTLDKLDEAERLAQVRSFPGRLMSELYERATVGRLTTRDLVPEVDSPCAYSGKNSAPAFRMFAKQFWRSNKTGEVFGYNHQFWRALSGPGYFVARDDTECGEVIFDYTQLPTSPAPTGWPNIRPNTGPIARIAFLGMIDKNRRISSNTIVGRGFKGSKVFVHYLITRTTAPR